MTLLLAVVMILPLSACGEKNKAEGVDKSKVDYILGEDEAEFSPELDAIMTELSGLVSIAVYGMYDFPEDMNPDENIKTVEAISMDDTLDLNKEFIQKLSEDFKKLSVESVKFLDVEIYEEEGPENMFGVIGIADIIMDDVETELYLKVVMNISEEGLPRLFTVFPYDSLMDEE